MELDIDGDGPPPTIMERSIYTLDRIGGRVYRNYKWAGLPVGTCVLVGRQNGIHGEFSYTIGENDALTKGNRRQAYAHACEEMSQMNMVRHARALEDEVERRVVMTHVELARNRALVQSHLQNGDMVRLLERLQEELEDLQRQKAQLGIRDKKKRTKDEDSEGNDE